MADNTWNTFNINIWELGTGETTDQVSKIESNFSKYEFRGVFFSKVIGFVIT